MPMIASASAETPRRAKSARRTKKAQTRPMATMRPYVPSVNGPMWMKGYNRTPVLALDRRIQRRFVERPDIGRAHTSRDSITEKLQTRSGADHSFDREPGQLQDRQGMRPEALGHQPRVAMGRMHAIGCKNLRAVFNRIQVPPASHHLAVAFAFRPLPNSGHPLRMVGEVVILMNGDNRAGNID